MRFEVSTHPRRVQTILILAAAFLVFSVGAFIVAGRQTGIVLLVASGVMLTLFALEQGKVGWYYQVDDHALIVHRTFKSYALPGESIVKVSAIRWPAVRERIQRYQDGRGPQGSERKQVALGRLIGFCTVNVPLRGPAPQGRETCVLLTRSQNREYILSPADPTAFITECQRLVSRTR